jgi:hypothetical protein
MVCINMDAVKIVGRMIFYFGPKADPCRDVGEKVNDRPGSRQGMWKERLFS